MKIYLCLFLFALICCNPIIKKDEPKLLEGELTDEEMKTLLDGVVNIVDNCGFDYDCISGQLTSFYDGLPEELQNKLKDLIKGDGCENICEQIASQIVSSTIADIACEALCSNF